MTDLVVVVHHDTRHDFTVLFTVDPPFQKHACELSCVRHVGEVHCHTRTASVLPALLRLEKRCHQSATERLAKLGALRRQPFVVAAGTIFGVDGAATLSREFKALTDASIEVFACACATGALHRSCSFTSVPTALSPDSET